jgi:hypothetical protein
MKKILPITAAVTAAALVLTTTPANAAGKPGLDAVKKVVTARLDGRLETLRALSTAVSGATRLTAGHKSSLNSIIDHDRSGLTALRTKVAGETTAAAVKADATSMVDDFRVFLLVVPQVHLVVAIDLETAAAAGLTRAGDKLTKAGKDIGDLHSEISAATAAINGEAGTLLAVKPSADATAMKGAVSPVRTAVRPARTHLKTARADAKT